MIRTDDLIDLTEAEIEEAELKALIAAYSTKVNYILNSAKKESIGELLIQVQILDEVGFADEEIRQMKDEINDAWTRFYDAVQQSVNYRIYKRML